VALLAGAPGETGIETTVVSGETVDDSAIGVDAGLWTTLSPQSTAATTTRARSERSNFVRPRIGSTVDTWHDFGLKGEAKIRLEYSANGVTLAAERSEERSHVPRTRAWGGTRAGDDGTREKRDSPAEDTTPGLDGKGLTRTSVAGATPRSPADPKKIPRTPRPSPPRGSRQSGRSAG
jgi:hypothetical protein